MQTASRENKLGTTYRFKANDNVSLNAGYSYGKRDTDSDPNAITAFFSTKYGTKAGQNGGDYLGYYPFFNASRTQQTLKAGVNWQAHERLSLGMTGRYTDDKYGDSTYGVQNGNSWSLNFDATLTYSEDGSVFGYVTQQHRQRELAVSRGATGTWFNQLKDNDTTIGAGFKQGGLMGEKLELAGDLTYSLGKTRYSTQVPYLAGCDAVGTLSCGELPDIRNSMTQFKFTGTYKVDKRSKVALGYIYQRLNSADFYYNGLQYGLTPTTLMPTNQQSGSYSVNMASVTYIYNF